MEAVPRLPMLSFELKHSPEYVEFGPILKQYIRDHYGEDPALYNKPCTDLEQLRQSAIHVTRDFMGCSTLKKYYAQLQFLQGRFPMGEGGEASIAFTWEDIQTGREYILGDIKFEQACILYNIGSLHSILGAMDMRNSAEGMKVSCTHFQCAAWAFEHLRDYFGSSAMSTDMSHELLSFHVSLMLAQGQECILEKSMIDSRKNTITAKVAAQVVDFYRTAIKNLEACNQEGIVSSRCYKDWKKRMEMKTCFYQCITYYYMGRQAEDQQKMGERLAYFQASQEKLNESLKLAKNEVEEVQDSLKFAQDVVGGKFNSAKKDNDFVYHEKVPAIDTLPEVKGASLVKGIPFNPADPEISGHDIFHKLVPMEAHEASSVYSEEKAKVWRGVSSEVDEKTMELEQYMSSLQLDATKLLPRMEPLPQELLEKCAAMSVKTGAIQNLIESMAAVAGRATEVELNLKEITALLDEERKQEEEFQKKFGNRTPNIVLSEIRKDAEIQRDKHKQGNQSNENLHKAMNVHIANLRLLAGAPDELQATLPKQELSSSPEDEAIVQELQRLLGKVNEMKKQRGDLLEELRTQIQGDDITNVLVTQDAANKDVIFSEQLKKHDKVIGFIQQNLSAQDNILRALTDTNARYASIRKATGESIARRDARISELIKSYEVYEDLMGKSQKGLDYYKRLEETVSRILQRCRSVCKVQQEERDQIMKRFMPKEPPPSRPAAPKPMAGPSHTPSPVSAHPGEHSLSTFEGPKLKDYLPFMKPATFGPKAPGGGVTPESPIDPNQGGSLPASLSGSPVHQGRGGSPRRSPARQMPAGPAGFDDAGLPPELTAQLAKLPAGFFNKLKDSGRGSPDLADLNIPQHRQAPPVPDTGIDPNLPPEIQAQLAKLPKGFFSQMKSGPVPDIHDQQPSSLPIMPPSGYPSNQSNIAPHEYGSMPNVSHIPPQTRKFDSTSTVSSIETPVLSPTKGPESDGTGHYHSYHNGQNIRYPGQPQGPPQPHQQMPGHYQSPGNQAQMMPATSHHGTLQHDTGQYQPGLHQVPPQPSHAQPQNVHPTQPPQQSKMPPPNQQQNVAPVAPTSQYSMPSQNVPSQYPQSYQQQHQQFQQPSNQTYSMPGQTGTGQISSGVQGQPKSGQHYAAGPHNATGQQIPSQHVPSQTGLQPGSSQPTSVGYSQSVLQYQTPDQTIPRSQPNVQPWQGSTGQVSQVAGYPGQNKLPQSQGKGHQVTHVQNYQSYPGASSSQFQQPAYNVQQQQVSVSSQPVQPGHQPTVSSSTAYYSQPSSSGYNQIPPTQSGMQTFTQPAGSPQRFQTPVAQPGVRPPGPQTSYAGGQATQSVSGISGGSQHQTYIQPGGGLQQQRSQQQQQHQPQMTQQNVRFQHPQTTAQYQYNQGVAQHQQAQSWQQVPQSSQGSFPPQQPVQQVNSQQQQVLPQQTQPSKQMHPHRIQQGQTQLQTQYVQPQQQQQQHMQPQQQFQQQNYQQQQQSPQQQHIPQHGQQQQIPQQQQQIPQQQQQVPQHQQQQQIPQQLQQIPHQQQQQIPQQQQQMSSQTYQPGYNQQTKASYGQQPIQQIQPPHGYNQQQMTQPAGPQVQPQQYQQPVLQPTQAVSAIPKQVAPISQQPPLSPVAAPHSVPASIPPQHHLPAQPHPHQPLQPVQPAHIQQPVQPSPVQAPQPPQPSGTSLQPQHPAMISGHKVASQSSSLDEILSSSPGTKDSSIPAPMIAPKVLTAQEIQHQKEEARKNKGIFEPPKDPYPMGCEMNKFVMDVETFGKLVDELTVANVMGQTKLDSIWKELIENQEHDGKRHSIAIARCYPMKNRDPDIMPYDETRVMLSTLKDDYINASWVNDLAPSCPKFVSTQAPIPVTVNDFWVMVYEQGVEVISMITSEYETGKKFPCYWPTEKGKQIEHGPVILNLQSVKYKELWTERIIHLKHAETKVGRTVVHLQYKNWPVSGFPENVSHVVRFITEVHNFYKQQRSLMKPVLVHCGSGIGRSGSFLLIYTGMQEILQGNGLIDVPVMVGRLLQKRKNMVQNKEQIKFSYDCILYFAEDFLKKKDILVKKPHYSERKKSSDSHSHLPAKDDIVLGSVNLEIIKQNVGKFGEKHGETHSSNGELQQGQTTLDESPVSTQLPDLIQQPTRNESAVISNITQGQVFSQTDVSSGLSSPQIRSRSGSNSSIQSGSSVSGTSLKGSPQHRAEGSSIPSSLVDLQNPSTFTLGTGTPDKRKITKSNFSSKSSGLKENLNKPDDPLSSLDPMWSVGKK